MIETLPKVPSEYLKYIDKGVYEIRVRNGGDIFRVFCLFDAINLIVVLNAFQKKTQKIPLTEIRKALKIKNEYECEIKES